MNIRIPASATRVLAVGFSTIPLWLGAQTPSTPEWIVYSRGDGITGVTWVARTDGGLDLPLAPGANPRLSRNGRQILTQHDGLDPIRSNLYRRDLLTGIESLVVGNSDYIVGYSWLPDDSAFLFDQSCYIYRRNVDGSSQANLITDHCWNDAPSLSPDGTRIAYHNNINRGLWTAGIDGSARTPVPNTIATPNGANADYYPVWSPDGSTLAFINSGKLLTIRPDGTARTSLTDSADPQPSAVYGSIAWSADGSSVVAAMRVGGTNGLYLVPTNGSGSLRRVPTREGDDIRWVDTVRPGLGIDVEAMASTTLSVDAPPHASVGKSTSMTFRVRNHGPQPTTGLVLTGSIPATVTLPGVTVSQGSGVLTAGGFTASLGTLPVGATATVTLQGVPSVASDLPFTVGTTQGRADNWLPKTNAFTVRAVDGMVGQIDQFGAPQQYHFDVGGDQLQNWYFDSLVNDPNIRWTLTGPFGTVAERTFQSSDGYSFGNDGLILRLAPGGYDLTVRGNAGTKPRYAFNLVPLESAALLTPGAPVTSTLVPGNSTRLYQFPGRAGDKLQLQLLPTNLPSVSVRLIDPFGQVLQQTGRTGPVDQLLADGTYTVLVEGYTGSIPPVPSG